MHYALNLRTFIYSHYFYLGLRVAVGILGLTLLTMAFTDSITIAMTVGVSAFCTSLMEMPSPLRHKFHEMMAGALLCTVVSLIVSLCGPIPWLMAPVLVVLSFFVGMTMVYGKKSNPLQLASVLIMTLSMVHPLPALEALEHSAIFLAGGLAYVGYAMAVSWVLRHRTKQQVLAEALFELAHYVDIKADFYDMRYNLTDQFNTLVRHQSVLADRHQAARDLILRGPREPRDAIVTQVHIGMLDLYELILSTHTDYTLLREHLADSDALLALRDIAAKCARDIESIAYAVTRNRASHASIDYSPQFRIVDEELQKLHQRAQEGERTADAQQVLRAQRNKLQAIVNNIARLHLASQVVGDNAPLWAGADMALFLSQQKYTLALMFSNMHLDSPIFRHSLRLAMAVAIGLALGAALPYQAHAYWIVLTIAVILRPSYSVTKRRLGDRITGTAIGCLLTFIILTWFDTRPVIFACLFLAMVVAPTFLYLRYRYAALGFSMMVLLQMHLLAPEAHLIRERFIDTIIGGLIATAFSFVLASWEYRGLPRLIRLVLDANVTYMEASFRLLQGKCANDFLYRIQRKRLLDSLANLSAALLRMLDEPASKQRAAQEINQFVVQNYLLVAHVAALRYLLVRHAKELPQDEVNALLVHTHAQIGRTLAQALRQHGYADGAAANDAIHAQDAAELAAGARGMVAPSDASAGWSGWPLLLRRVRLLQADAERITVYSAAIVGNRTLEDHAPAR